MLFVHQFYNSFLTKIYSKNFSLIVWFDVSVLLFLFPRLSHLPVVLTSQPCLVTLLTSTAFLKLYVPPGWCYMSNSAGITDIPSHSVCIATNSPARVFLIYHEDGGSKLLQNVVVCLCSTPDWGMDTCDKLLKFIWFLISKLIIPFSK